MKSEDSVGERLVYAEYTDFIRFKDHSTMSMKKEMKWLSKRKFTFGLLERTLHFFYDGLNSLEESRNIEVILRANYLEETYNIFIVIIDKDYDFDDLTLPSIQEMSESDIAIEEVRKNTHYNPIIINKYKNIRDYSFQSLKEYASTLIFSVLGHRLVDQESIDKAEA